MMKLIRRGWAWFFLVPVTLAALTGGLIVAGERRVLDVPGDYPTIQAAVDAAHAGASIRVAAGVYPETILITRPVTIEGPEQGDAIIRGESGRPTVSIIDTENVAIRHLTITGGDVGVLVRGSGSVEIADNKIVDNRLRGVRVVYADARILRNEISRTSGPYGKGIHIANTMSWPASLVQGNLVEANGSEGIITNMARVIIRDNLVRNNGLRGVGILEMSIATVEDNTIAGNADAGLLVLDMSHAEVTSNYVLDTRAGPTGSADGIRLDFHSEVRLVSNHVAGNSGCGITVFNGSVATGENNALNDNLAQALCGPLPETLHAVGFP